MEGIPMALENYFLWCFDMLVLSLTLYKGMFLSKVKYHEYAV